jgi:hypothetical protein
MKTNKTHTQNDKTSQANSLYKKNERWKTYWAWRGNLLSIIKNKGCWNHPH